VQPLFCFDIWISFLLREIYFHISEVQTSVHRERKSLRLWKYTSQINVQRKYPDLQFLAAVGHIAVCTVQAEDLVTIFFRLLSVWTLGLWLLE